MPEPVNGMRVLAQHGGTFRDASFICICGRTGSGKTVDAIAAFPRAMVFALTRELKPAITVLGYHPPQVHIARTLYDVEAGVDALLSYRAKKDAGALWHNAVVVDDLTVLAYQTEQALREGVRVDGRGTVHPKGWDLWTEQRNTLLMIAFRIAEKLRQAGLHFCVNGHLRVGRVNNAGKVMRGGIDLPTDLTESFSAGTDLSALIEPEVERLWHQTVFRTLNFDQSWATKNRYGLPEKVPSNTAEILRGAGYYLPRPVGHEAFEGYVETLATYVYQGLANNPYTKVNIQRVIADPTRQLAELIKNPLHVRWILRDSIDRAFLRRERERGIYLEAGLQM
jgi:hypothetical protein